MHIISRAAIIGRVYEYPAGGALIRTPQTAGQQQFLQTLMRIARVEQIR